MQADYYVVSWLVSSLPMERYGASTARTTALNAAAWWGPTWVFSLVLWTGRHAP